MGYYLRNRIREVRKMKNITQTELVEDISITRQYVSLIELEEETPSLKVADEINVALETCMYAIFDLDGTGIYSCACCDCS